MRVALWLVALTCVCAQPLPGYDILLIMGQSNAEAVNTIDFLYPTNSSILTLNHVDDNMVVAQDPPIIVAGVIPGHGVSFQLTLARLWAANRLQTGRTVLIVNCARGGTGFGDGTWLPAGVGMTWCRNRTTVAMNKTGSNRVVAVCWQQGEADVDVTMPLAYMTHLQNLIAGVRGFPGVSPTTPFMVGQMSPYLGTSLWGRALNRALRSIRYIAPFTYCIPNENVTASTDVHFDAPSQRAMGQMYYDGIAVAEAYTAVTPISSFSGMRQRFSFEDGLNDTSGNALHGTLPNMSGVATQVVTDSTRTGRVYAAIGYNSMRFAGLPRNFSVSFWYKANLTGSHITVSCAAGTTANACWTMWHNGFDETVGYAAWDFAADVTTGAPRHARASRMGVADNVWTHLTITWQRVGSTDVSNVYTNGLRYSASGVDGQVSATATLLDNTGGTALLGEWGSGAVGIGRFDDVVVFNRAISQEEVMAVFLQTSQTLNISYDAVTSPPTAAPTSTPTAVPTANPTASPTAAPSATPTAAPTPAPTPLVSAHVRKRHCAA